MPVEIGSILQTPVFKSLFNFTLLLVVVGLIVAILPTATQPPFILPVEILNSIDWIFNILWSLNFIININALLFWFQIAWYLTIFMIAIKIILFIIGLKSMIQE